MANAWRFALRAACMSAPCAGEGGNGALQQKPLPRAGRRAQPAMTVRARAQQPPEPHTPLMARPPRPRP
eukprot:7552142-Lingulodinium_polyedra.AAC.1